VKDNKLNILNQYWGFSEFRPLQEEIINQVIQKKDVLALLPTGGGKSICYQLPAILMEGVCIVISPLIALMQDQVESLQKKGIKAELINSSIDRKNIDRILDNCIYGQVKLLYIAPERIQSQLFKERFKRMNVSFIAVDEAHCISQWGNDFRPSYRSISILKEWRKDFKFIALTATATQLVTDDIQEQLSFSQKKFFKKIIL
jgi:ATP-dependent DNA helicase RecQ